MQKNTNITEHTPAESPTRRARKAAATRRALFEAGLEAFGRRPFGLVSVLDLTETVDVAKGVFYLHFKSKDEFLIELLLDILSRFLEGLDAALSTVSSRSARIQTAARHYVAFASANPSAARFLVRMAGYFPDEIGPPGELARVRSEYRDRLAAALGSRPSKGLSDFERRAALMLDASCWGLIGNALQLGTSLPGEREIATVASSALRFGASPKRPS